MRKLATITTALILALAVGAGATINQPAEFDVRPFTMGGEKINNILKSQSNIWLYPQTLNMYADQAEGVFDNTELRRLGIHYQFGTNSPFVLGIYVNNTSGAAFNPYGNTAQWVAIAPFETGVGLGDNNLYDVFWARDMNGNPFGVHLQVYNSSNENTSGGLDKNSLSVFALDVGLTTSGGQMDWAGSIGFTTFTEELLGADVREPDGNINIEGRVRKWFSGGWVGHASAGFDKTAFKTTLNGATEEWATFDVEIGLGLNYTPSSKVHAVLDFGFQYTKADNEVDLDGNGVLTDPGDVDASVKEISIPPYYALGFDAEVLGWLDIRLGASNIRRVQTVSSSAAGAVDVDAAFDDVNTYVGVGMHWGNLTIDANIDPQFVTEGPDFIGGDGTNGSNNMFMYLAATYNFGN